MKRLLFLDPAALERMDGACLRVNPPVRTELLWTGRGPWEKMCGLYLTVIEDGGRLRMWYGCRGGPGPGNKGLAYAESSDGVNWERPDLGVVEFGGSRENNLVNVGTMEGTVFTDPHAPPEGRYAYVASAHPGGIYRWRSADGLRWQRDAAPLMDFSCDTQNVTFWDPNYGKYVGYFRGWSRDGGVSRRTVVRWEADALDEPLPGFPRANRAEPGWRPPHIVDEAPVVLQRDAEDPDRAQPYTMAAMLYPVDPRYYVAFPTMYYHYAEPPEGPNRNEGRCETHFAGSADGIAWHRYDRAAYAPLGLDGSRTAGMAYLGVGMAVRGDEIWQYGFGYRTLHGTSDLVKRLDKGDGTLMRFVQRVDGFVSVDTDNRPGEFRTAPVTVDGDRLLLNINVGALGVARVALLAEDNAPIEGFSTEACDPLRINSARAVVSWQGRADLSALRGRAVKLLVSACRCKLFSARFGVLDGGRVDS